MSDFTTTSIDYAKIDSIAQLKHAEKVSEFSNLTLPDIIDKIAGSLIDFSFKLAIAIFVFYVGRFIIHKLYNVIKALLIKRNVELSLLTFVLSLLKFALMFFLIIIVIGILGIETSSFIALFASAGVAVGMALSGTLQNFAGGVLILLIKPYKVGDYIEVEGYSGKVKEIQIFFTILNTVDNKSIIIPNGKLSTGSINNYSKEGYRQVEWNISISYGDNIDIARKEILRILAEDSRIIAGPEKIVAELQPAEPENGNKWHKQPSPIGINTEDEIKLARLIVTPPTVVLKELADSSIVVMARAWTKSETYWSVYYDINEKIYNELPESGINFPFPQLDVHLNSN
ncbi:MAG: mechanosensitive ion channel family protein [Muribaculaceae bacterium]